jgi:hypothetical protein
MSRIRGVPRPARVEDAVDLQLAQLPFQLDHDPGSIVSVAALPTVTCPFRIYALPTAV